MEDTPQLATHNSLMAARQAALNRITARLVMVIIAPLVVMMVLAYGLLAREGHDHTYLMAFAFLTGVLGGFVSVQQRLPKATLIELQALGNSWTSLFMMPITGGVFALVLYIMFTGEILTGALFPAFSYPVFSEGPAEQVENIRNAIFQTAPKTASDLSKLIFWAFVAGFMERFVPRLIRANASGAEIAAENITITTVQAAPAAAQEQPATVTDSARVAPMKTGVAAADQGSRVRRTTP